MHNDDSQTNGSDNARRVWAQLHQMFGQRLLAELGAVPGEAWTEALAEFPWRTVKGGLARLLKSGAVHPPSLPLFLAMVRNEHQPPPTVIQEPPELGQCEAWAVGLLAQYSWWRIQHGKPSLSTDKSRDLFREAKELGTWFQAFVYAGDANATREKFLEKFLEHFVDAGDRDALRAIEQQRAAVCMQTSAQARHA